MELVDVTGVGSGAVFLIKGKANLLFEAGMAYAADAMVEAIRRELGEDGKLDAVLLSHSHYDHVAGLPALRRQWPELKSYASRRAQEIVKRPGALAVMRRLSAEAAEAAGLPWDSSYDDADLRVDVALEDGETVTIGDHTVYAFATVGHTRCSLSYVVDGEVMLCSETVGVLGEDGGYMPSYLVDYLGAEESISRSRAIPVKEIILNHHGPVGEGQRDHIWDLLEEKLAESKEIMIRVMNEAPDDSAALRELERIFHAGIDKKWQPDEAFYINAASMMKTLRRQFPERFARRFCLIAAADRHRGIGNKGRLLVTIPEDQALFSRLTAGKIVVLGRKTFQSLPGGRPLPGRVNLVLSRNGASDRSLFREGQAADVFVCRSVPEALAKIDSLLAEKNLTDGDVWIAGGEEIYRAFLPYCRTAFVTRIDYAYEADAYLPDLEQEGFRIQERSGERTFFDICYEFARYEKKA